MFSQKKQYFGHAKKRIKKTNKQIKKSPIDWPFDWCNFRTPRTTKDLIATGRSLAKKKKEQSNHTQNKCSKWIFFKKKVRKNILWTKQKHPQKKLEKERKKETRRLTDVMWRICVTFHVDLLNFKSSIDVYFYFPLRARFYLSPS